MFPSIVDAVKAGYATTKQNATRKLNRGDEGWRYAHFDQENKPLRIPYQLKAEEMSYEQYCESLGVEPYSDKKDGTLEKFFKDFSRIIQSELKIG